MRISDWSSDVCSSDLTLTRINNAISRPGIPTAIKVNRQGCAQLGKMPDATRAVMAATTAPPTMNEPPAPIMPEAKKIDIGKARAFGDNRRSEEHTSELQSLLRISYAVFFLKKNNDISTTSH